MAQDERWRRALDMQVERVDLSTSGERVSNTYESTFKSRIALRN